MRTGTGSFLLAGRAAWAGPQSRAAGRLPCSALLGGGGAQKRGAPPALRDCPQGLRLLGERSGQEAATLQPSFSQSPRLMEGQRGKTSEETETTSRTTQSHTRHTTTDPNPTFGTEVYAAY